MGWGDAIPRLSDATMATLAAWGLGAKAGPQPDAPYLPPDLPANVLAGGPAAVIDHAISELRNSDAGRFWYALRETDGGPDAREARAIFLELFKSTDWRPGFALGALRALDTRSVWDADGILLGLELARGITLAPGTVAQLMVKGGRPVGKPLSPHESLFSDPAVLETLGCLDAVVAAQERQDDRLPQVLADMRRFGPQPLALLEQAVRNFKRPIQLMPGPAGTRVVTLLRGLMEEALGRQHVDFVQAIDSCLLMLAARYGSFRDCLLATHRCAMANFQVRGNMAVAARVATALEHCLAGALQTADLELQATLHHALALVLRGGLRKMPGLMDGVVHMQRAMTTFREIGNRRAAVGAQIDLTSLLIMLAPFANLLDDAPADVQRADEAADAYLQDAIDQLADGADPVDRHYLGEALCNLARLGQFRKSAQLAGEAARAALAIGEEIGHDDLRARAMKVLGEIEQDPGQAMEHRAAAARLVQDVRRRIGDEDVAVAWLGGKEGLFDGQLDYILTRGREAMSEADVCSALVAALEDGRGLTYNRWLGVKQNASLQAAMEELTTAPECVLAIYAVTPHRTGLVILAAGAAPSLHILEIAANDIDRMARQHLSGLCQQGWTRLPIWDAVQDEFTQAAAPLLAPLEPFVAAGRTICVIPHQGLHALNLHTAPTVAGGRPVGLRTALFSNPSLTNWLHARQAARSRGDHPRRACVAAAAPAGEQASFDDFGIAESALNAAGCSLRRLDGGSADLQSLAHDGVPWDALHLDSHGVFREERHIYGLMLAAGGQAPPPPLGDAADGKWDAFLATPARLRKTGIAGRLTFLASCVSARSLGMPGDDLMGLTRAFFASGTTDLVAGGWTVVSDHVATFAGSFYAALGNGQSTAHAMLTARQHLAASQPDPFFWGCLMHQGADAYHLRNPGRKQP